ncbi:MAG TPA: SdpI family protein [Burkholderiaceae bacterium]
MQARTYTLIRLILAGTALLAGALLYAQLPERLPVHWNAHMQANGFLAKPWGVWTFPVMTTVLALLAELFPLLSPKGYELRHGDPSFQHIMLAITAFGTFMTAIVFAGGMGLTIAQDQLVGLNIGLLIAVLGNVLSKVRRNFFIGIRTPWTLASEEVWLRTHRLGGRLLLASGLLVGIASLAGLDTRLPFLATIAAALISVAYSFVLYRRLDANDRLN